MGDVLRLNSQQDGLPDWVDPALWEDWRSHRREMKKPMTPTAERRLLVKLRDLIIDARPLGWDFAAAQEEIVGRSIEFGWRGLFPLHDPPQGRDSNRADGPLTMRRLHEMSDPSILSLAADLGVATRGKYKSQLYPEILEAWKRKHGR